MRLTMETVNAQLDILAASLDGGSVEFYEGPMPPDVEMFPAGELLARVPLSSPAFSPAINGRANSRDIAPAVIGATGVAQWGRFVTIAGVTVGDFLARTADAPDAKEADAILERTDFHRGGLLTVPLIILRLPQSS